MSPASVLAAESTPLSSQVAVTVTGNRVIDVRIPQAATWDLSRVGAGLAGVAIERDAGLVLDEHADFGVALVASSGTNGGFFAAMFDENLEAVLNYGRPPARELPQQAADTQTCSRCAVPAGDYKLYVWGPYRSSANSPALRLTLSLTGLTQGLTAIPDAAGRGEFIISYAPDAGFPSDVAGGGGIHSAVFPLFYDGALRSGVYVTQATVTGASTVAGAAELSLTGQVNNDPEVAPGVAGPGYDISARTAGASQGVGLYEVRGATPAVLDTKFPYVYAHGDTWTLNHPAWEMDLAMLWLTTDTQAASSLAEPALRIKTEVTQDS